MSDELILYRTDDGLVQMQLRAKDGSIWLSQLESATLFDTTKQNASLLRPRVTTDAVPLEQLLFALLNEMPCCPC